MAKQNAPATERNRSHILAVLERVLPQAGVVVEIAAGTGEHAAYFARHLPHLTWQPSDRTQVALDSINAWAAEAALPNLRPALAIDVMSEPWPVDTATAVVCINMIHISPWECTAALFRGAERLVSAGGVVYLYGPFRDKDTPTAGSNERFDEWLKARDPAWGLRWLHEVEEVAAQYGFSQDKIVRMPANNLSVVFQRN